MADAVFCSGCSSISTFMYLTNPSFPPSWRRCLAKRKKAASPPRMLSVLSNPFAVSDTVPDSESSTNRPGTYRRAFRTRSQNHLKWRKASWSMGLSGSIPIRCRNSNLLWLLCRLPYFQQTAFQVRHGTFTESCFLEDDFWVRHVIDHIFHMMGTNHQLELLEIWCRSGWLLPLRWTN